MQSDKTVVQYLNSQLKNELTAINQYFLHARLLDHLGLKGLGKKEYEESLGEMKHADRLIERIFMLEGLPNVQDLGKIFVGESVEEIFESDLALEVYAQKTCKEAIAYCEQVNDYVSRDLFLHILSDTEAHIDWLETQRDLIKRVGLENYQQSAICRASLCV